MGITTGKKIPYINTKFLEVLYSAPIQVDASLLEAYVSTAVDLYIINSYPISCNEYINI